MSGPYTPDEFNVRMAWTTTGIGAEDALDAEFDRFIAAIKAEAWDEGYKCGGMDERHDWNGWEDPFENPYRSEASL